LDINGSPKILSGPIEKISMPRPKYNSFNPSMEMVVDITATVNGERREFKGVPNGSIADFGNDSFVLAESRDALNSYINAMLQNSRGILNSVEKHEKLISNYEEALQELNPSLKADREKDRAIQTLQDQVSELKQMLVNMAKGETEKI
jgi:predicted RNase H-like nuclease (RuvC/YqgF family)